jgi:hypothetical protein
VFFSILPPNQQGEEDDEEEKEEEMERNDEVATFVCDFMGAARTRCSTTQRKM